eukprot:1115254-Rhodomonas_salina.1
MHAHTGTPPGTPGQPVLQGAGRYPLCWMSGAQCTSMLQKNALRSSSGCLQSRNGHADGKCELPCSVFRSN